MMTIVIQTKNNSHDSNGTRGNQRPKKKPGFVSGEGRYHNLEFRRFQRKCATLNHLSDFLLAMRTAAQMERDCLHFMAVKGMD